MSRASHCYQHKLNCNLSMISLKCKFLLLNYKKPCMMLFSSFLHFLSLLLAHNTFLSSPQPNDPVTNICQAADKQLFTLVEWAKRIPHFSELSLDDQVILLRAGKPNCLCLSDSRTCKQDFLMLPLANT